MKFDILQGPGSGLAYALNQPSPSLAQSPAIALPPRNNTTTHSEQQKAITVLLDQHDYDIFAYLRVARSLDENVHYFPGHGSLSSDLVLAVWALRACADDEIRTWLEQARELGENVVHILISQELTPISKLF